jgi:hypothetical protein
MLSRFPGGFVKHAERAPGSIDEVRVLDGAAELEDVPSSKEVARGCTLVVRGWGFDPLANTPAKIVLTMDDRFAVEATVRTARDDISEHFQREDLKTTGFKAMMSTGGAAFAPHNIRLYVLSNDGSTYFDTSSTYSFDVVPARQQIPDLPATTPGKIHVGVDVLGTMAEATEIDQAHPKIQRGDVLIVRGWAFDRTHKEPCKRVFIALGDECVRAIYGVPREDVVADQQVSSARYTGFTARLSTASLPLGRHTLSMFGVSSDGSSVSESTHPVAIDVI